jgi:murein DD-endopeptidase MepM/ murein hydrolase activator NlpD
MGARKKMKFRDNHRTVPPRRGGRYHAGGIKIIRIFLLMMLASLACSLPLAAPPIDLPTPEPIIWWTNTPAEALPPEETVEPLQATMILPTATLPPTATVPPDTTILDNSPYLYNAQAGDTLHTLSVRFSVLPEEITSETSFNNTGLLVPGQLFVIPRRLANTTPAIPLLPDSEVVHSLTSSLFDTESFVNNAGGYLKTYNQYLSATGLTSGIDIVNRVALENSISPRLLLSLLQYHAGWVFGQPPSQQFYDYPMGLTDPNKKGLFEQLTWAVGNLSTGYYGWREGLITDLVFRDGVRVRVSPELNAGSVAVMYYFSQLYPSTDWLEATNPDTGFSAVHASMFGNPWEAALLAEPLFPATLRQPEMILPFARGDKWSYSGGPHGAWGRLGARAAIDFAPPSETPGCVPSDRWVTAAAPGLIVRSSPGVLVLDLDGDGNESTGWALLYLHLASEGKLEEGTWVTTGQFLGNPSCEGGFSTGTHIHIARKYNGEWILAGGPVPFILGGWTVQAGNAPYEGTMTRGDKIVEASPLGMASTLVSRDD